MASSPAFWMSSRPERTTATLHCFQGKRAAVIVSFSAMFSSSVPLYHIKLWF